MVPSELWTPEDVATAFQVDREWVMHQALRGRLPSVRLSRKKIRFRPEAVRQWAAERELRGER